MNMKGNTIESNAKNQIIMNNIKEKIIMKKEDELRIKNFNVEKKNKKYLIRNSKDEYTSKKKKNKNEKVIQNLKFNYKANIFISLIFLFNLMLIPNFTLENTNEQNKKNLISFIIEGNGKQKYLGNNAITK